MSTKSGSRRPARHFNSLSLSTLLLGLALAGCNPTPILVENCEDGEDNDGDDLVDCEDPSCGASAPCSEDGDLDGVSPADGDCDDDNPLVNPGMGEDTSDGIDNDCDGKTEVSDSGLPMVEELWMDGGVAGGYAVWLYNNQYCMGDPLAADNHGVVYCRTIGTPLENTSMFMGPGVRDYAGTGFSTLDDGAGNLYVCMDVEEWDWNGAHAGGSACYRVSDANGSTPLDRVIPEDVFYTFYGWEEDGYGGTPAVQVNGDLDKDNNGNDVLTVESGFVQGHLGALDAPEGSTFSRNGLATTEVATFEFAIGCDPDTDIYCGSTVAVNDHIVVLGDPQNSGTWTCELPLDEDTVCTFEGLGTGIANHGTGWGLTHLDEDVNGDGVTDFVVGNRFENDIYFLDGATGEAFWNVGASGSDEEYAIFGEQNEVIRRNGEVFLAVSARGAAHPESGQTHGAVYIYRIVDTEGNVTLPEEPEDYIVVLWGPAYTKTTPEARFGRSIATSDGSDHLVVGIENLARVKVYNLGLIEALN